MTEATTVLTLFVLAAFVGVEVVSKVSSTLHTPLMSGANAIHGIILVGAIAVTAHAEHWASMTLAVLAVVLATANLVGGFVVTDRMLGMFAARPRQADVPTTTITVTGTDTAAGTPSSAGADAGTTSGSTR